MESIYIIGHKNPDADSICSALAYADFKESIGEKNYKAARCGNSNARIDRILEKFSATLPQFVGDVRARAKDAMNADFIKMHDDASCFSIMDAIDKNDIRSVPMIDSGGKLLGELCVFDLGEFFIPHPKSAKEVRKVRATLDDIIKTLNATALCKFKGDVDEEMYVRIGAMEVSTFGSFIEREGTPPEQNLIVVGDRFDIQIKAVQMGVRAIIITGGYGIDQAVVDMAQSKGVSVLMCKYDSATTALLVRMATRALPLIRKDVAVVPEDFLISKISARAREYSGKTIYVCDSENRPRGILSTAELISARVQKLVLVDHNELSQAVTGADECEVVEIIDHHRIGVSATPSPILFLNKPVGSTCTIVSGLYRENGIKPSRQIAGLLCSGIVCDTLNLKSPTATKDDAEEIKYLCEIIGMTSSELADYIFSADSALSVNDAVEIITSDCKRYREENVEFSVSQIEELDFSRFFERLEEIRRALEKYRRENGLLFSALFVTNVMTQDSLLMISGGEKIREKIGYVRDAKRDLYELPKIVSRKKQLIPYLSGLVKDSLLEED